MGLRTVSLAREERLAAESRMDRPDGEIVVCFNVHLVLKLIATIPPLRAAYVAALRSG